MARRTAATLARWAGIGTVVVGLAGCSTSTDGEVNRPARSTGADAALAWARCMREQGVDVRDPKIGADGSIEFARPIDDESPERKRAATRCRPLLEGSDDEVSAAETAEAQRKLLRYARCMRRRGVDVPDPLPPPQESKGPPVDVTAPSFQRADEACHRILFPD